MTIVSRPFEGAADAMSTRCLAGIVGVDELSSRNTGPLGASAVAGGLRRFSSNRSVGWPAHRCDSEPDLWAASSRHLVVDPGAGRDLVAVGAAVGNLCVGAGCRRGSASSISGNWWVAHVLRRGMPGVQQAGGDRARYHWGYEVLRAHSAVVGSGVGGAVGVGAAKPTALR